MVKMCSKCGKEYGEEDMFCLHCGVKLVASTPNSNSKASSSKILANSSDVQDKKVCTKCGELYKGSATNHSCPNCGGRLVSMSSNQTAMNYKGFDFGKIIKIVAVCLLLLLFIPTMKYEGWSEDKEYSVVSLYGNAIKEQGFGEMNSDEVVMLLFLVVSPFVLFFSDLATYTSGVVSMVAGGLGFIGLRMLNSVVEKQGMGLVSTNFFFVIYEIGFIAVVILVGLQMYSDWQRAKLKYSR